MTPTRCRRALLLTFLLVATLVQGLGAQSASAEAGAPFGQADHRHAGQALLAPGPRGQAIRARLDDAQNALAAGDVAGAEAAVRDIGGDLDALADAFVTDPAAANELRTAHSEGTSAAAGNDPVALAAASGAIWTTMLRGAYAETIAAASEGRAVDASAWLLLREFRPTTKFERPNANATLALRDLAGGAMTPDEAVLEIRADLLDTYQAQFTSGLADVRAAGDQRYAVVQAEAVALAAGYWQILEPAYRDQVGAAAVDVDGALVRLEGEARAGDIAAVASTVAELTAVDRSFRAAPLSEAEQARRAGQLVRYLSLVSIEYGRGIRNGEVAIDLEIGEAQAFIEGARASFDDLYLILDAQDPVRTAEAEATIAWMESGVAAAARRTGVVDPGEMNARSEAAIDTLGGMFPEAWTRSGGQADFDVISSLLDQVESAMKAGRPELAESARLEAYAIYELGAEKRLLAFAPDLANETEALFWGGTSDSNGLAVAISQGAGANELHAVRVALDDALDESQERIGAGRPSTAVVIFNAATIVFREGLEAVLILASLVASMMGANRKFKRPLMLGAGLALAATALLFWAAQTVLQSLARYGEKLEAIISLVAIGVLLLVMNWFFHKVYWTKWISKHHTRRRALVGGAAGQALGLVILGFTSVFREGAETVLFLQALVLDAGTLVVIEGTLLGLLGTAIVAALVIVLQKKLPHKRMLSVTGVMLAFVLVVMVGNTTHVLQVVGWLPITPIAGLVLPFWTGIWFGVFATWQGVLLQAVALAVVIGSYYAAEWVNSDSFRLRRQARPQVTA